MARHRIHFASRLAVTMLLCVIFIDAVTVFQSSGQSAPVEPPRSPAAAFQLAVKRLTDEARQSWKEQKLLRSSSNFAEDFTNALPAEYLAQKLARRQHEHPFIDAYIRWQLISLKDASIPEALKDRQFQSLLTDLPHLLENPRADRETITALVKTVDSGELTEAQQERATKQLTDLATKAEQIAAMNRPALEYREWIAKQVEKHRQRSLLAGIERCAALVDAGWPSDETKTRLDEQFTAAAADAGFSSLQRQSVIATLQPLIGRQRVMIVHAAVQDNRMYAQYADTAILDFDVRRWCRLIQPE